MTDDPEQPFEAQIYGLPVPNPQNSAHGREPLEVLATEFIDAVREGRNPYIEDYVARHPELREEILELFPLLAAMEGWKSYRVRTSLEHRALGILSSERFGDFRILREIGRGSMGIVFEAEKQVSGRRVAVKVLPFLTSKEMRERFEREAHIAARLSHPHIVPVSNFGEFEGLCYYVMQLVCGVSLDWLIQRLSGRQGIVFPNEIVAQFAASSPRAEDEFDKSILRSSRPTARGPNEPAGSLVNAPESSTPFASGLGRTSWIEIAKIGMQVAGALQYAHSHGTLHRDIKPANVLLDAKGHAWLTDFGLAKDTAELAENASAGPAGTLRYMAPEQFSGHVDVRSDIYSLGVTLFELLTRTSAFSAHERNVLVQLITQTSLPRPRERNPWVPRDLDAIVAMATARDPSRRYQTAMALKADLARFIDGRRVRARGLLGWLPFSR